MTLDLYITFDKDTQTFTVLDNSYTETVLSNITIWDTTMTIPQGNSFTIDNIDYIYNKRESYEIAKFIPSNFGQLTNFKDGIYNIVYNLNDNSKTIKFILYNNIEETLNQLIEDTNYSISVNDYDIEYTGIMADSKGDLEKINLCNSLLLELKSVDNDIRANEIISQLNLLLGII